jgi:hypothetical protein
MWHICTGWGYTPIPTFVLGGDTPRYKCRHICTELGNTPVQIKITLSLIHLIPVDPSLPFIFWFFSFSPLSISSLQARLGGSHVGPRQGATPACAQGCGCLPAHADTAGSCSGERESRWCEVLMLFSLFSEMWILCLCCCSCDFVNRICTMNRDEMWIVWIVMRWYVNLVVNFLHFGPFW